MSSDPRYLLTEREALARSFRSIASMGASFTPEADAAATSTLNEYVGALRSAVIGCQFLVDEIILEETWEGGDA
jgi:hypothetical protein